MLGPLAKARFEPELHSGGRPEAVAAADRFAPCPTVARNGAGDSSTGIKRSGPRGTRPAYQEPAPDAGARSLPRAGLFRSRLRARRVMSERSFYEERAKREAKAVVEGIEAQTSAEIVVCLRGASDTYRDADYLFGFLVSLGALVAMLFVDHPFARASFPLGLVAGFLSGAVASANVAQIRRLLVFPGRKAAAVSLAARGAFHDQGVTRTHGRTGILLYVSMFERRVEVLLDVGINSRTLGLEWKAAVTMLEGSLSPHPDVDRFLAAARALGPILGRVLPRAAEEENELPNEVR
jgi:putative membrane protein